MKPRLQKEILDHVLKEFYIIFDVAFTDTEHAFKRKILHKAKYDFTPVKVC